jgi:hypothetical protein
MSDVRDQWAAAVLRDPEISHACARVAWALREYANQQGRTIVSNATLASDTGLDHRFVRRNIALLVARGYLARFDRGGNGYGRSNSAATQLIVPGLFEHQSELPLDDKRGVVATPALDGKTGVIFDVKGGNQMQKGGQLLPPRTILTNEPGADARASLNGSRAAPRKKDPLACAISLLNAPGIPYPDDAIVRNCGVTLEQLEQLRRARA